MRRRNNHSTKLIVLSGLQGSGKSTIAKALSTKFQLFILSVDPIQSAILKSGLKDSFEVGFASYLVAETLARDNLKNKISVIIDASNYVKEAHDIWENLADELKVQLYVIECKLDPKIHRARIEKRKRDLYGIPEVQWKDIEERMAVTVEWNRDKITVDTSKDTTKSISKILEYIQES